MRRSAAVLVVALLGSGCPQYLFEQKYPMNVKEEQITQGAAQSPPADILLVIDNSGSMEPEERDLAANLDKFINALAGKGDYHFGVVTMDLTSEQGERDGFVTAEFATTSPFNLTHFVDDGTVCTSANIPHSCFRGPDPQKRILKSKDLSNSDLIDAFRKNVTVGTCGSGQEEGLRSIVEALKHAQGSDCNQGFLRDDANLVIILISDDDDEDPGGRPAAQFVDDVAQLKDISKVRFAMIGGAVNGAPTNCRTPNTADCGHSICMNKPPDGDHHRCGTALPNACTTSVSAALYPQGEFCLLDPASAMGVCENKELEFFNQYNCGLCSFFAAPDCCLGSSAPRYADFALEIERRVHDALPAIPVSGCKLVPDKPTACLIETICQDNYGDTLARIARELINPTTFLLNPPAIYAPGIVVKIVGGRFGKDGIQLMYGTDFDVNADGTLLTIKDTSKAPMGDEIIEIYFIVDPKK